MQTVLTIFAPYVYTYAALTTQLLVDLTSPAGRYSPSNRKAQMGSPLTTLNSPWILLKRLVVTVVTEQKWAVTISLDR